MIYHFDGNTWKKATWARKDINTDVYLCCPGPSLADVPSDIRGRGRRIFAINTAYPKVIPDVWMGLDGVECYDKKVWAEPFIKVARYPKESETVGGRPIREFDNTYFIKVYKQDKSIYKLREDDIDGTWNQDTMSAMLHLMVWMGAKNIHLVGCDMGGAKDYYDERVLPEEHRKTNRSLYSKQVGWLRSVAEQGKDYGVTFTSCTPDSPLNDFMEYKDLDVALQESEEKARVIETPVLHVKDNQKDVILHCNNHADLGGIETTVIDIARSMPQYQHVLATVRKNNPNNEFIEYLKKQGVDHTFESIKDAAERHNPKVIFLHNTHKFKGDVEGYNVVAAHHGNQQPFSPATHNWFVSNWVKDKYAGAYGKVLPPPVHADDYLGIERPERKCVVGRIQSNTWAHRGKTTSEYWQMLRELQGCDYFVVGNDVPEEFPSAPIKCGQMVNYLQKIDVFTIWGDTTESWSKVVTEANLSGIPVVARNHNDGLAEQIRKSGGGVLVKSQKGFVQNVQYLIDNPLERYKMAMRGRAWALNNATTTQFKEYLFDEKIL